MSRSIRTFHTSIRAFNGPGGSSSTFTPPVSKGPKPRDIITAFTESLPMPQSESSSSSSSSAGSGSSSGSTGESSLSAPLPGAGDVARRALAVSARVGVTAREEPGRRGWSVGQRISPHHLLRPSLYPSQPPPVRPPLLGPPARLARKIDPFLLSHTKPLDYVWNPEFGRAFVNQMGRIQSRADTGLSWKSQRGIGKLVRRQRAMGILPKFSGTKGVGGYGYDQMRGW